MIPEILKQNSREETNFPPNLYVVKTEAEEKGNLIFAFSYGSYFGGECETLIIDNGDGNCSIYAYGYNDFDLFWKFVMPNTELESLEKVLQPAKKWLRNYEVQEEIFDGYGWALQFRGNGYTIKTGGYMANPWNFFRVANKIIKQLTVYKRKYSDDKMDDKLLPINGYKCCSYFKMNR